VTTTETTLLARVSTSRSPFLLLSLPQALSLFMDSALTSGHFS